MKFLLTFMIVKCDIYIASLCSAFKRWLILLTILIFLPSMKAKYFCLDQKSQISKFRNFQTSDVFLSILRIDYMDFFDNLFALVCFYQKMYS